MTGQKRSLNIWLTLGLVIAIAGAAFLIVRYSVQRTVDEPDVLLTESHITITGMYGVSYPRSSVTALRLREGVPRLGRKIHGAGLNRRQAYRGTYQVEGLGPCRVFLFGKEGPYIQMETETDTVLIMYTDANLTRDLYATLVLRIF